jgi:MSHA biogenesis protein MshI
VEFCADGIAFAHVVRPTTGKPQITHCEFLSSSKGDNPADLLRQRLGKLGLQNLPCNLVLAPGSYSLLLVEAPKVPATELREALRWRIKDLIHFPAADAVIDVFLLPEDSAKGANRMAYVVASERKVITEAIARVETAQLKLSAIDIGELALRNLAVTCTDTSRGIALVRLAAGGGSLQIVRNKALYLSRQFALPYNAGLLDDLPADMLVLEVQRSLDYFERQMRQPAPARIALCGENVTRDKIGGDITGALPMGVDLLTLEQGLEIAPEVSQHILSLCYPAIGAALRQEQEAVA